MLLDTTKTSKRGEIGSTHTYSTGTSAYSTVPGNLGYMVDLEELL